jgi:hypothetical protein
MHVSSCGVVCVLYRPPPRCCQAVVSTSEQKIGGLRDKLQEYTQEYSKLQVGHST